MKITVRYNIGDKSMSAEFKSFSEIDEWFKRYCEIKQEKESAYFDVSVILDSPQAKPDRVKSDNSRMPVQETAIRRDNPEDNIHTKIKQEVDKDYSISAEDICECGHYRGEHTKAGCHFLNEYHEACPCKLFAFPKEEVKNAN